MSLPEFLSFRSKNYALVFRVVEGQPVKIYDSRIDEDAIEKVTFFTYPTGEDYQLKLRYKVNKEIAELIK